MCECKMIQVYKYIILTLGPSVCASLASQGSDAGIWFDIAIKILREVLGRWSTCCKFGLRSGRSRILIEYMLNTVCRRTFLDKAPKRCLLQILNPVLVLAILANEIPCQFTGQFRCARESMSAFSSAFVYGLYVFSSNAPNLIKTMHCHALFQWHPLE